MSAVNFTHFRFKDITGLRSGKLVAIRPHTRNQHRQTVWQCQCDCGVTSYVVGNSLSNGHSTSCGCTNEGSRIHGMSKSSEYHIWKAMWQRCTNPNDAGFHLYKYRTPPEIWRDFSVFFAELGPRPGPGYSLDRINNNKPYGPGNCRWAVRKVQNRNTSRNLMVDVGGYVVALAEACDILGFNYRLVYTRIARLGWDFQRAVTQPVRGS